MVVHLPSEKSILPYFSGPRGVAISVPFPEVRNRKGAESGLDKPKVYGDTSITDGLVFQVRDQNIVAMCKEMGITVTHEHSHTLYNLEK